MSDTKHHKRRKAGTGSAGLPRKVEDRVPRHEPLTGNTLSPRFLDETVAFWQPAAKRPLTREDAREIVRNLSGFFGVLREWQRADEHAIAGETPARNRKPDPS